MLLAAAVEKLPDVPFRFYLYYLQVNTRTINLILTRFSTNTINKMICGDRLHSGAVSLLPCSKKVWVQIPT